MGERGWNFSLTNEVSRREPQSFGANEKIYSTQAWNKNSKSIWGTPARQDVQGLSQNVKDSPVSVSTPS